MLSRSDGGANQGEKTGNSRLRGKLQGMRVPRVFGDLGSISREIEMEKERRRDRTQKQLQQLYDIAFFFGGG